MSYLGFFPNVSLFSGNLCSAIVYVIARLFLLVPDSTECTKFFLSKSAVHYLHHLNSNNIVGLRKTANTKKLDRP